MRRVSTRPRLFAATVVTALLMTLSLRITADDRPVVISVNYALSYFAERLGGNDLDVVFPVPEQVDPAFWRPAIADISTIQSADLIILNGAGFASWTEKVSLPRSRTINTTRAFKDQLISTESITHSHGADGEHSHTGTASFTWLDQHFASLQAQEIAHALKRRGLVNEDEIKQRLAALEDDLAKLHELAKGLRAQAQNTVLVATHPRYQYLAGAYGLNMRYLDWDAGASPDAGQLAELSGLKETDTAKVLLWESAPPPEARAAVRQLGFQDLVFPTLATVPVGSDYLMTFQESVEKLINLLQSLED